MAEDGPLSQADIDALTSGLLGEPSGPGFDGESLRPAAEIILEQGSTVLTTLLGRPVTIEIRDIRPGSAAAAAEGLEGDGLSIRTAWEEGVTGESALILRKPTAAYLAGVMMGGDGASPFKDEDLEAMGEVGNQFIGAAGSALGARIGRIPATSQSQVALFNPSRPPFALEGAVLVEAEISVDGGFSGLLRMVFSASLAESLGSAVTGMGFPDHGSALSTKGSFDDSLARNIADSPPNIQMLLDINLNVTIELGRTRLSIRKVLELGPGSIIELDRLAGEPVDLLVNDKVVAKGEVVVVDEYFGIRVISLVSPEERIKQLK